MRPFRWLPGFLVTVSAAAALIPVSVQVPGRPVSVTGDGGSGAGEFAAAGRFVFFVSGAGNLATNDANGGVLDLFRRDLAEGRTELISVTKAGDGGRGPVSQFSASPDGRQVAFTWATDDRLADDTNGLDDIYLRDLVLGTTRLLSINREGTGAGNGASSSAVLSGDGRFVVFESGASDLVAAADTNGTTDVFLHDLETGQTGLISQTADGSTGDRQSRSPLINADGRRVVFTSDAMDLAPLEGFGTDLLVWNQGIAVLRRVKLPGMTAPLRSPLAADNVVLSADGRYLAFAVASSSPVSPPYSGVWWLDLDTDELIRASGTTPVVSGPALDGLTMSADGRTLAFSILTGTGLNAVSHVRVWTPETGMKSLDELRLTVPPAGSEPAVSSGPVLSPDATALLFVSEAAIPEAGVTEGGTARLYHRVLRTGNTRLIAGDDVFFAPTFSADGSQVVYEVQDPVFASGDDNDTTDVVVTSLSDGRREVVSVALPDTGLRMASGSSSGGGGISDDGRWVAFSSIADDLVAQDTNQRNDAFGYDRQTATNQLISIGPDGTAAGLVQGLRLARDGRRAAFVKEGAGLTEGDQNSLADVYVRDLAAGSTVLASAADGTDDSLNLAAADPQISGDGRWVAFRGIPVNAQSRLYLRDLQEHRTWWINDPARTDRSSNARSFQLSADGRTVLFLESARNWFVHRQYGAPAAPLVRLEASDAGLSADGRVVVFTLASPDGPEAQGLYYQVLGAETRQRLLSAPQHLVRDLQLSSDGSVVTYARRSDPVPPALLGPWQVWAFSVRTGLEEVISANAAGGPGNGDSREPKVSADGRFIAFRSEASDLVPNSEGAIQQVFVRDRYTGGTTLLSRTTEGQLGNLLSTRPEISGDGRYATFTTFADNLLPGDHNGLGDVVLTEVPREPGPDTDGDGLPDGWERDQFGSLAQDAAGDADGDGRSNGDESAARTVPTDSASHWRVVLSSTAGVPTMEWVGHAGVFYQVERRDSLAAGAEWVPVGTWIVGHEGTVSFPLDALSPGGLFRVKVVE